MAAAAGHRSCDHQAGRRPRGQRHAGGSVQRQHRLRRRSTAEQRNLDVFVSSHGPDGKLRYSFALGGSGLEAVHGIAAAGTGRWRISFYLGLPVTLGDQLVAAGEHLLWVDEL